MAGKVIVRHFFLAIPGFRITSQWRQAKEVGVTIASIYS